MRTYEVNFTGVMVMCMAECSYVGSLSAKSLRVLSDGSITVLEILFWPIAGGMGVVGSHDQSPV